MSYDLQLTDPVTGDVLELDAPHSMQGGTYAVGGTICAAFNITYNYAPFFYRTMGEEKGVRSLYGLSGAESLPLLDKAIAELGDYATDNYWDATEGNAKKALLALRALALLRPDGVWAGD